MLARGAIALLNPFFDRIRSSGRGEGWLDSDTARPTQRLFKLGVWLFAIVMAYPYLPGAESEAFKGMSVLIGLMVTVGGSGLIGQAASGLILTYSRTLRLGEYVRISDQEGTVTEIGTFTTKIRTGLGEEITLPNAFILGNVSKNYSRAVHGPGYIVDTVVTIGYDTPWRQVEAMLLEAAHRTAGVLETPKPRVFQTALSDFYPEYRLVCQAVPSEPRPRAEVLAACTPTSRTSSTSTTCRSCRRTIAAIQPRPRSCPRTPGSRRPQRRPQLRLQCRPQRRPQCPLQPTPPANARADPHRPTRRPRRPIRRRARGSGSTVAWYCAARTCSAWRRLRARCAAHRAARAG